MLKINLSDGQDDEQADGNAAEETSEAVEEKSADTLAASPEPTEDGEETAETSKPKRKIKPRELVLIALLCVAAVVYYQKDMILGLFSGMGEKPVETVEAPPPAPEPAPEPVAPPEPDPTLIALEGLRSSVPQRAWLTAATILYDGTYEIKGMAFTHDAALQFVGLLGKIGSVAAHDIPKKRRSSESMYPFVISGKMANADAPEILDTIPPERLSPMAETLAAHQKDLGIAFLRLPEQGKTYADNDLPFALEGTFENLEQVIRMICPDDGDTRVYRLSIMPAKPGKGYNRIRASFSLKTLSSI